jgi:hypothetical protein
LGIGQYTFGFALDVKYQSPAVPLQQQKFVGKAAGGYILFTQQE